MSSEKEKHKDWTNGEDGGSFSCVSENKGRKESTLMFSAPLSWHPIASPPTHPWNLIITTGDFKIYFYINTDRPKSWFISD